MILESSEVERLLSTEYSGLVRVLKSSKGRIKQIGYLYFKKGRLEEGYLEDRGLAGEDALRAVKEGDYLLDTGAGGGHAGDKRALLESLRDDAVKMLEDYE